MDNSTLQKEYNYNTAILKILMSFIVVCCHFYYPTEHTPNIINKPISALLNTAVPIFFMCSFYMYGQTISGWSCKKVGKRSAKLWIPNIIWGIASFAILNITYLILHLENISIKELLIQLCFGCSARLCSQMWFNTDLLLISLLLWVTFRVRTNIKRTDIENKKDYLFIPVLGMVLLISFIIQYSGVNHSFFYNMPFHVRYTFGRMIEVLPYACMGLILSCLKKKPLVQTMVLAVLSIIASIIAFCVGRQALGFSYQGLETFVKTMVIWGATVIIPFRKFTFLDRPIRYLAGLTPNIYYIHMLIGLFLQCILTAYGCSLSYLYIIVYILSVIISILLPKKV